MKISMDEKRQKIFQQFVYSEQLSFSELFRATKISSNLLAYFLKSMVKGNILEKRGKKYCLSEKAEKLIPFFVKNEEMISPLVVVLVAIVQKGKVLLIKREKRPYKGFWSIVSGRLLINETIRASVERIALEKAYTKIIFKGIKSIIYERLTKKDKIKHGFVFFLVEAEPLMENAIKEKSFLRFFDLKKLKKREVIDSDYWMLKHLLGENTKIYEETINERKKTTKMTLLG